MSLHCEARVYSKNIDVLRKFWDYLEHASTSRYRRRRGRSTGKYVAGIESVDTYNGRDFHFSRYKFSSIFWMNINFTIEGVDELLKPALGPDILKITDICAELGIDMRVYAIDSDNDNDLKEISFAINHAGEYTVPTSVGKGKKLHEIAPYDFCYTGDGLSKFNKSNKTSYTRADARYVGWYYYFTDLPTRIFVEPENDSELETI